MEACGTGEIIKIDLSCDERNRAGLEEKRFSAIPDYDGPGPEIRVYQIPSEEIGYLSGMVESHEGIGLVRTLDRERGIIECWMMPGFVDVFEDLLTAVQREFPMQRMNREFD